MDKRMNLSEKMSMENNAANQESNGEMFVRRVASSGLVLKFKVDKYGTLPSKHTISTQEVMMSGGKEKVTKLLDNFEANCSPNAISLLEQSDISAAEARSKKISLFDNAKVAPPDEIVNTAAMVDKCTTMLANQIVSSRSITVGSSNGVSRMNKASSSEKANKMEHHPITENDGNNGSVLHRCNECGKGFKEISSLNGHKGIHRREEYKRMRLMLEQQPISVEGSHVVSSSKPQETMEEKKTIWYAAGALRRLLTELKRHWPDDLSGSMTCSNNKHISTDEETDEMREVAEILLTLAQSFCKDSTVHVSMPASTAKCFVCTTCKKKFSSYHALGGHMSIHNNKPTKNSLLEDGGAGSSGGGREYVCDKCNEKFPTGQILGGHKRKHWWEEHYKMALLEDQNVKPPLQIVPHHEAESSGLVVVPTDENIQPAGTGLVVVAAHTVPLACDAAVQQPQQAMSLDNEIELPVPSGVSESKINGYASKRASHAPAHPSCRAAAGGLHLH